MCSGPHFVRKGPRTFYMKKMTSIKLAEIKICYSLDGAEIEKKKFFFQVFIY